MLNDDYYILSLV